MSVDLKVILTAVGGVILVFAIPAATAIWFIATH
jgi:hypothetical protein